MWTGAPSEAEIKALKISSGQEIFKMLSKIKKANRKDLIPQASEQCLDLIAQCLEFDPDKRITI